MLSPSDGIRRALAAQQRVARAYEIYGPGDPRSRAQLDAYVRLAARVWAEGHPVHVLHDRRRG